MVCTLPFMPDIWPCYRPNDICKSSSTPVNLMLTDLQDLWLMSKHKMVGRWQSPEARLVQSLMSVHWACFIRFVKEAIYLILSIQYPHVYNLLNVNVECFKLNPFVIFMDNACVPSSLPFPSIECSGMSLSVELIDEIIQFVRVLPVEIHSIKPCSIVKWIK